MCAFSSVQMSGKGLLPPPPLLPLASGEVDVFGVVEKMRMCEEPDAVTRAVGVGATEKISVGCAGRESECRDIKSLKKRG